MACRICKSDEVSVGVCASCLKAVVQTSNRQKNTVTKTFKRHSYAKEYRSYFLIAAAVIGVLAIPLSYLTEYKLTFLQRMVLGLDIGFFSLLAVGWMMIPVLIGMDSIPNLAAIVVGGGLPVVFNPSPWMLLMHPELQKGR